MNMFEYDRLALDVAEQVAQIRSHNEAKNFDILSRRLSNAISSPISSLSGNAALSGDPFDCGASSGYGSPGAGGTPLASPAPHLLLLPTHLQRAFDHGFFDEFVNESANIEANNNMSVLNQDSSRFGAGSPLANKTRDCDFNDENNLPAAVDDGFSATEIEQFAQLLASPKKAPPIKYQCHICYQTGHYISDCPMRFNSPYEELTPYQGRKKCYGEFQCQHCKRKWTSQNSVANEAQSCIKCHVPVFPHKQLPVDKAVAMGLVKAQKTPPSKLAPIGHGRPPFSANRQ